MTAIAARTFQNLTDVSTDDLRDELARALEITADNLVWLARLWRELERRGEDLRELRTGLRTFLPLIADGRLDAQAAVQFAGNLTMLRALATLPIQEQRRIAGGGRINVVSIRDGEPVTKAIRADELSARLIRQVFATGRVRSEDEQRLILTTLRPAIISTQTRKTERIRISTDNVGLWRRIAERRNLTLEALIEAAMSDLVDRERAAEKEHGQKE